MYLNIFKGKNTSLFVIILDDSWLGQASTVLKRVYKGFMKTFEIEETEVIKRKI